MPQDDLGGVSAAASATAVDRLDERLARAVVEKGLLPQRRVEALEHRARWLDRDLQIVLEREGGLEAAVLLDILSDLSGIPVVTLADAEIEAGALSHVAANVVAHYRIMPVRLYGGELTVATDSVREIAREDQLRIVLGTGIRWMLAPSHELFECIKHYYGVGIHAFVELRDKAEARKRSGGDGEPADVQGFVREIIGDAVRAEATDIHVEPFEDALRLRYRIDGVLTNIPLPEGADVFGRAIVSSIKVMSQMNIAEHRMPQDGRFSFDMDGQSLDIRVSVLPSQHGETANLRLLNSGAMLLKLDDLVTGQAQLDVLQSLVTRPHGMVLFTGATGSGKTTSLYASLARLNDDERKIITIEDPVEYRIHGVTQLQVNPDIEFTFASGLRSILRHDPDVVLVGEIRDEETARIAVSAALTGHLVFSTLHTNDSASTPARLVDMGIAPYLVSTSVEGIVAQQLVRRVCRACGREIVMDPGVLKQIETELGGLPDDVNLQRGQGCPTCRYTGYRGRRGIFEMLVLDDALRSLIVDRVAGHVLMQHAMKQGLKSLRQSGWTRALSGETTVAEVLRVTPNPHT